MAVSKAIKVTTEPVLKPVELAETIKYARGNTGIEDDVFDNLIAVSTSQVQTITEQQLITATTEEYFQDFPWGDRRFFLMMPPVQSITSIKYFDTDGVQQTWASSNYTLINNSNIQGYVQLTQDAVIPSLQVDRDQAITIEYLNGYGLNPSDVPEDFRTAIKLFVNDLYYARQYKMQEVSFSDNIVAMQVLQSRIRHTPDVISIAQLTQISGAYVR